jgi:MurNAc alpha-1-phosphate uridylyltransferase
VTLSVRAPIKTAMVLAAGLGVRMRPLTASKPKALVEVMGKALIDHALDRLAEAGVETAVVNVHHFADLLEAHLKPRRRPRIAISDERSLLLETGGGIVLALHWLGEGPFYLVNSDSLWLEGATANLPRLARAFDAQRMDALLLLAPAAGALGYGGRGDYAMNGDGRLTARRERDSAPLVYAGAAVLSPRLFDGAPAGPFPLTRLFDRAEAAGRLYGLRLEGLWMHVGTPEAIAAAEAAMQRANA